MTNNQTVRRVLLVDDSSTSRMITRRCFEMAFQTPLEFVEAPDGAEALSLLEDSEFDLIVTDLNMPKMDGTTFVWKVKKAKKLQQTPIIVLSSLKNERTESALGALGVKEFIQKPVSPAKIMEYVGWE
jgi:two-component system, chemotaxis family, chemotaxis protein CheY